jgi:serine protease Do
MAVNATQGNGFVAVPATAKHSEAHGRPARHFSSRRIFPCRAAATNIPFTTMNRLSLLVIPILAMAAGAALAAAPASSLVPNGEVDSRADRRTPVVVAVEKAAPCVVNISTKQVRTVQPFAWADLPDVFKEEFPQLFRPQKQVTGSLGSGVIISPKGYIVTNAHVVQQADEIIVTLSDETQVKAELVSMDPAADLAIIKAEAPAKPFKAIRLGTSSDLMIGETVIAVGNPFGYQHTVTTGVVSALERTLEPAQGVKYEHLIQTDAPINPGNSGGPLLNIRGELIGINTAIRAGAQGLGFAIPVNKVREIMIGLLSVRRAGHPWLGLTFRADRPSSAVVARVDHDSPALKAGLKPGDAIESLDAKAVTDCIELETSLLDRKVGDTVRLGVRRAGSETEFKVTLAEAPKPDGAKLARAQFGLHVQVLKHDMAESMHLTVDHGLLVAGVDPDTPGAKAGIHQGDVIIQVDRYRVEDLNTLGQLLDQVKAGDGILIYIVRGRYVAHVVVTSQGDGPAK